MTGTVTTDAIRRFIDAYNDRVQPFAWTKTADQILAHATPRLDGDRLPARAGSSSGLQAAGSARK